MFIKIIPHLVIGLIFFILTLTQQYLFYFFKNLPIVWLPVGKYFAIYFFLLAATFTTKNLRIIFLSFILFLNFFQMAHLSYFGTQILPSEIALLFTQLHEISGTLFVELHHVFIPLFFTIIPIIVGIITLKKFPPQYKSKIVSVIFCLYFIYNPLRTYFTGNTWGRQPSTRELSGMNLYLALSYFSGKILPNKILGNKKNNPKNSSTNLVINDLKESDWDNIIFILGESLSPHQMSLFGHEKNTTPFLSSQVNNPDFFHTIGLAGGVSTDISVAFLMNLSFGEAGSLKASTGEHCLFKLAKQKKFSTHFFSIQSSDQLRYISPYLCSSYLDTYKSLEDISPETADHQSADDKALLPELNKIIGNNSKQFILLHQRGSHAPWEVRSIKENRRFPHNDKINHYNNSVVEFDIFMQKLSSVLKSSNKKSLVIYMSDHGEALGQEGHWGHGRLNKYSFEVPVLIMSFNKNLPDNSKLIPKYVPHFNLALFMANELGFSPNHSFLEPPQDYEIFGNDIDGFAGRAKISFGTDNTYDFKVID